MLKAVVLILAVCGALSALSLDNEIGESKPPASMGPAGAFGTQSPTTTPKPTTTNTTAPTPKPTTTNTTTPTPKPTTTNTTAPTPKPTTTNTTAPTPKPTTTNTTAPTPKPTTTNTTTPTPKPTTTNTTTPTPTPTTTNTTTPTPTTTTVPATTPSTTVTVGNYNLTTGKDICLRADMGLTIRLESKETKGSFIVDPEKTSAKGQCKETTSNLTLVFPQGFITFLFKKNVTENLAYVDNLSFKLSYPFANGGPYSGKNSSLHLFSARIGHAYSCKKQSVYMGNGLYLDVTQDRMQAFNLTANDFGSSDPCPADKPDYRVAIAVGVTLLVLIVVVLVVYLLGRRRRTDGYQSL